MSQVERPSFSDWAVFIQRLPATYWNHERVYGKELNESYRPNFSTSLAIEYWRDISGVSAKQLETSGVYNLLGIMRTLIKKYDTFIDSPRGSLNSHFSISDFKKEQFLGTVSDLVSAIDSLAIPRRKKQELCHRICQFRRDQLLVLNSQDKISSDSLTFNQAVEIRKKSSGQIGILLAETLNAPFNIPEEKKRTIKDSLYHFCVAGQAVDDVTDCQIDWQGNHPNIFLGALNENPQEKLKFIDWIKQGRKIFTFGQLVKLAPRSAEMIEKYIHQESALIPSIGLRRAIRCALYFPHGIVR